MFRIRDLNHPLTRPFWLIVSIGPAAVFALLWKILNANYLPRFGETGNSTRLSLLVGIIFGAWTYFGICDALKDRPKRKFDLRRWGQYVLLHLLVTLIAIPTGRIVFSILPPYDNSSGALIGLVIGHICLKVGFATSDAGRFIFNRGTVLLTFEEAMRRIKSLTAGSEPRIKWAGCNLPGEISDGNFLIAGAIGTGKTRMHRELIASLVPSIQPGSDRRIIIYDVKSDLLSELAGMNPSSNLVVFNPFDRRSVGWDLAADVETPTDARNFAESLIQPSKSRDDTFFITGARNIVAGVINKLNAKHPRGWTLRHLVRITATRERLASILGDSDLVPQYFEPPDTFSNIRNTIANVMVPLEQVAALWEHTKLISLKEWVKTGDSILVLGGKADLQASLQTLNRVALKMISTTFLSQHESPRRTRLWFFCDELKEAGRLDSLPALLNGRSKGVRCVLGFQDIEGLESDYGNKEVTREILSRCTTVSFLKLTSPDTADWASKKTGEVERFEFLESQTAGKGEKSVSEHLTKREAILRSEFMSLPDFIEGNVEGFHLIKGVGGVYRSVAKYKFSSTDVLDFDPRPAVQQELSAWNDQDKEWLGDSSLDNLSKESSGEAQTNVDLGTLGRVNFEPPRP